MYHLPVCSSDPINNLFGSLADPNIFIRRTLENSWVMDSLFFLVLSGWVQICKIIL